MMDYNDAAEIYRKYKAGTATPEERALLEQAYVRLAETQGLPPFEKEQVKAAVWNKVVPKKTGGLSRWLPYAAAALVFAVAGAYMLSGWVTDRSAEIVNDIGPGSNRATLMLADGRTIPLREDKSGIIIGDSLAYEDGSLIGIMPGDTETPTVQLKLSTPRGGQYQVTLPDGTRVWLNSSSTLEYPNKFTGGERVVLLDGEAYFSVTKQEWPFKVLSNGQAVEVLGTEFNISAYSDDPETKTTLVEGRVQVSSLGGKKGSQETALLKPNQQSVLYKDDISVRTVGVSQYTGWKDGLFVFNNTDIQTALKQLSRWYDVDVEYDGVPPKTHFYGTIGRDETLSTVLNILKRSGLQFKIERSVTMNKLIVQPGTIDHDNQL
ncbi:FecR family protein [Parapedobacter deserti]|uniref:FecR family protein n=1 Tax=Parapedobacter deserti TaxID=1912957 RepID=A0ABV7JEQ4_9SPHI